MRVTSEPVAASYCIREIGLARSSEVGATPVFWRPILQQNLKLPNNHGERGASHTQFQNLECVPMAATEPVVIDISAQIDAQLLKADSVASLMSISRAKAYDLMKRGMIPTIVVGASRRVPRRALEKWIEAKTQKAA